MVVLHKSQISKKIHVPVKSFFNFVNISSLDYVKIFLWLVIGVVVGNLFLCTNFVI